MTHARGRGRLRGARPCARAVAALRQRGDERRRAPARRGATSREHEWLPRIAAGDAILTPAWLEPDSGFGPRGVQLHARRPTATSSCSTARSGTCRSRSAADALVVLARTGDRRRRRSTCSSSTARHAGRHAHAADDDRVRHAVPRSSFDGVRVPASARIGAAGTGWATWDATMLDGHRPARRAGDGRRGATRSRSRCSTRRTASSSTSRSARSRRSRTTSPTRSATVDGGRTLVYEAAWARANGRPDRPARADGEAVRVARRSATSPRWRSRSSAASASRVEYDIQLYFRRAKQLQLAGGTTATSKSSSPRPCSTPDRPGRRIRVRPGARARRGRRAPGRGRPPTPTAGEPRPGPPRRRAAHRA